MHVASNFSLDAIEVRNVVLDLVCEASFLLGAFGSALTRFVMGRRATHVVRGILIQIGVFPLGEESLGLLLKTSQFILGRDRLGRLWDILEPLL